MEEILHQLRLVVYPIIYTGFIHPNGGWPRDFFHQQHYADIKHAPQISLLGSFGIDVQQRTYTSVQEYEYTQGSIDKFERQPS